MGPEVEASRESRIRGYKAKYYAKNMEKVKAAATAWKRENPGRVLARSKSPEAVAYRKAYHAAHYEANKERIKARVTEWKKANSEWAEAWRKAWWAKNAEQQSHKARQRRYGISQDKVASMLAMQNNLCDICGDNISSRFVVDHNHNTGEVRGLLCGMCNRAIGMLKDSQVILKSAIGYIAKHDTAGSI